MCPAYSVFIIFSIAKYIVLFKSLFAFEESLLLNCIVQNKSLINLANDVHFHFSYRSRDEIQEVRQKRDPINGFKDKIIDAGLTSVEEIKVRLLHAV